MCKYLGQVLHELAGQKESKILKGHLKADHVHALVSITPKYSVAQVVGFIKLEDANSLVQAAITRARGYRSDRNFITMIYRLAGKLKFELHT